jgi:hypothetical protein
MSLMKLDGTKKLSYQNSGTPRFLMYFENHYSTPHISAKVSLRLLMKSTPWGQCYKENLLLTKELPI